MNEPGFLELQPCFVGEVIEFVFHIVIMSHLHSPVPVSGAGVRQVQVLRAFFAKPRSVPHCAGDCRVAVASRNDIMDSASLSRLYNPHHTLLDP